MDNLSIARVLHEIADVLEIKGENAFRIRSLRIAGDSIRTLAQDVASMVRRREDLKGLPGVGAGIASRIEELVETGAARTTGRCSWKCRPGCWSCCRSPAWDPRA